jgi:hypothetical protein
MDDIGLIDRFAALEERVKVLESVKIAPASPMVEPIKRDEEGRSLEL